MKGYWVYENWIHDYARVHKSTCSYCNDGHGLHGGKRRNSGTWHGPFRDVASANNVAAGLRHKLTTVCAGCCPV